MVGLMRGILHIGALLLLVGSVRSAANETLSDNAGIMESLMTERPSERVLAECLEVTEDFIEDYGQPTREQWCDLFSQKVRGDSMSQLTPRTFRESCMALKEFDKDVLWKGEYITCCEAFAGTALGNEVCGYGLVGSLAARQNGNRERCAGFITKEGSNVDFCNDSIFDEAEDWASTEGIPRVVCNYYVDGSARTTCRVAVNDIEFVKCGSTQLSYFTRGKPLIATMEMQTECCKRAFGDKRGACCEEENALVWGWGQNAYDTNDEHFKFFSRVCDVRNGKPVFAPKPLISDTADICLFSLERDLELSDAEWFEFCGCLQDQGIEDNIARSALFKKANSIGKDTEDHGRARFQLNLKSQWVSTCGALAFGEDAAKMVCPLEKSKLFNPKNRNWAMCS